MKIYAYDELRECDLVIDAVYEGDNNGTTGDDPISKILPVGNQGGFRYSGPVEQPKFIVLYSSGENIDWPDSIDTETGIFKYYGDNKKPGHELHDTSKKGNLILKNLFDSLYAIEESRKKIPPIFIFKKYPTINSSRSVQFKGLCVPGTVQKNNIDNLVAIWKSSNGLRFQNYTAFFTILDISIIHRQWITDLDINNQSSLLMPAVFARWKTMGKYEALRAPKSISIRKVEEQLPTANMQQELLKMIYDFFSRDPHLFEYFAAEIYRMSDSNVIIDEITRTTKDGGRDCLGRLKMGLDEDPVYVEFALEAKCYNPGLGNGSLNTVGVKEVSRLISRIRNRQYGILVTSSAISKQAYEEVREDGHPIIFISGIDIVRILIERGINTNGLLAKFLNDKFIPKIG